MTIVVQKFGGTSVANAEKIRRAAQRAIDTVKKGNQVVIVASARGKQTDEFITDAKELHPNPPAREMDQLFSTGEQQTVALFAMALQHMGQPAISFTAGQAKIMTDAVHAKARIISIDADKIHKQLDEGKVVLVAGFQGIDEDHNIYTLGRGGSDTSAVALAAALKADMCEIYTDVDGIYTTDPRIFKNAAKIDTISYDEMLELASLGSGVMHGRAIEVGKNYNVNIHVRSSLENTQGTIITHEVSDMENVVVSGAAIQKDIVKIVISNLDNSAGNIANIFAKLAKAKVVIANISKNKDYMSFTTSTGDLDAAKQALGSADIQIADDLAGVSIVGVGIKSHYDVSDKMFSALAKKQIAIDSVTTSEISISCLVPADQAEDALTAVCETFNLDKPADQR